MDKNFLLINKELIKEIGLVPTVILSIYLEKSDSFKANGTNFDGWFYLTHKKLSEQLNLKEYTIKKAKQVLLFKNLIATKKKGIPAKEYIKINFKEIHNLIKKTK